MTQFKGMTSFATLTSVVYLPTSKIIGFSYLCVFSFLG